MAETAQRVLNFSAGPAKLPEEVSRVYFTHFEARFPGSTHLPLVLCFLNLVAHHQSIIRTLTM